MRAGVFVIWIFCVLAVFPAVPALYGADDGPAASAKELERIKKEMQEKKKKIKRAKKKERSVLVDLDRIDRDIQAGRAELADQQKRFHESEADLRSVQQSSDEISRELIGLRTLYGQRLRALYKIRRGGVVAAYATESSGSMIKKVKYLSVIAKRDRVIIDEFGRALERLSEQETKIADKKKELLVSRRAIEAKKSELEAKRQKKSMILANVRREKGLYEQTLNELEESSVNLWSMIKKDEQERRSQQEAHASVNRQPMASSENRGHFPWPLEGPVLTRFGMQRHPQFGTTVFRRGIEIEAREGQAVHAVESGQVAFADWYKGYGKLVILDHGKGFYTLYGNLSRLDLVKGDPVIKGQVIGLAGETGSFKGSKLYFEIRRNGEAQDPLVWLSRK
jgi:septal ring factor EnvC (AmiA/AmiB activator)